MIKRYQPRLHRIGRDGTDFGHLGLTALRSPRNHRTVAWRLYMWTYRLFSWFAVVALLEVAACKNPDSSAGPPDSGMPAPDADGESCTADQDCMTPKGVCDVTGTRRCVQCTTAKPDACMGATPVCVDNQCQKCTAHAQCTVSNVCLPDGSCADPLQVAYVDPEGGDNPECSKTNPCVKVIKALAMSRPYVKLHGVTVEAVSINDQNVTLLADPGAQLTRSDDGPILIVNGSSQVVISDLEITGASGSPGAGLGIDLPPGNTGTLELRRAKVTHNDGGGINAFGGTLTVSQSTISDNREGGIRIFGAKFDIVGNVFLRNGSDQSAVGGVNITGIQGTTNRLEFNSFHKNQVQVGQGSAIDCYATFTARNNIMSGNGTATNPAQVGGPCMHTYSIVRPGTLPTGAGNMAVDPLFKDPATGDLHLQPGSPALGAADPDSDLTGLAALDIDGDTRTRPADIGADEIP
jgi:hypothetical protein